MKQVPAGKFKAECLAIMDQVQRNGQPLLVTKRGKPVVKVVPADESDQDIFGYLRGRAKIVGDIVAPASPPDDWEAGK